MIAVVPQLGNPTTQKSVFNTDEAPYLIQPLFGPSHRPHKIATPGRSPINLHGIGGKASQARGITKAQKETDMSPTYAEVIQLDAQGSIFGVCGGSSTEEPAWIIFTGADAGRRAYDYASGAFDDVKTGHLAPRPVGDQALRAHSRMTTGLSSL
jgi:hypothetical protein